ncbi:putative methyltransferase [Helianthus annuus]|nr:putative methyltransferase [Helianthus annuus]KAJ0723547.1 putative methyltransferase [Helianthus annuus]KAJ0899352.1 putative methyltransferase [Helianthus annuus]
MRESQHLPMKKTLNLHMGLIIAATTTCLPDSFKIYIHHSFVLPLGFASLSVGTLNQSPVSESQHICFSALGMAFDASTNSLQKPIIQIYSTTNDEVTPFWKEKYEKDANKYWDIFYKRHQDRSFKDRHYLDKEWGHYFSVSVQSIFLPLI